MAISREHLLGQAGTFDTREVHIPKWADKNGDDVVVVRGMTIGEFEEHQARLERERAQAEKSGNDKGTAAAQLIVMCMLDPKLTADDVNLVRSLGLAEVLRVSNAITDLSGFGDDEAAELEGNSGAVPSDGSSSDSPETSGAPSQS